MFLGNFFFTKQLCLFVKIGRVHQRMTTKLVWCWSSIFTTVEIGYWDTRARWGSGMCKETSPRPYYHA